MPVIDLHPRPAERLSFEDYLALAASGSKDIVATRIIMPDFGASIEDSDDAFGGVEVILKHPVYAAQFDAAPTFRRPFGRAR
jgi:hypothetical protein